MENSLTRQSFFMFSAMWIAVWFFQTWIGLLKGAGFVPYQELDALPIKEARDCWDEWIGGIIIYDSQPAHQPWALFVVQSGAHRLSRPTPWACPPLGVSPPHSRTPWELSPKCFYFSRESRKLKSLKKWLAAWRKSKLTWSTVTFLKTNQFSAPKFTPLNSENIVKNYQKPALYRQLIGLFQGVIEQSIRAYNKQ